MGNDAFKHEFANVLALVEGQMRDLSEMQQKRSALTARAKAADGAVEVSVDAQGTLTEVIINDSYLEEFELSELGGHITGAAREAAHEVIRRAAVLLEPLTERQGAIRALSDIAVDVPELGDVLSQLNLPASMSDGQTPSVDDDEDWQGNSSYPSVRK